MTLSPGVDTPGPTLVVLAAGQAKRYGGPKPLAPVGLAGEAVIDLLAGDAVAAGFGRIVLVISPSTGPAIRYHVRRTWPPDVDVRFAVQEVPRGTVDAVLTGAACLEPTEPFGVANADDLYGRGGLALLAGALTDPVGSGPGAMAAANLQAIVCYRLRNTLVGDQPVTRGVCRVGPDGRLESVDERRSVTPLPDGRIECHDGKEPSELDGDSLVSVNLWGFQPAILAVFDGAMNTDDEGEVLLPEVVGDVLAGRRSLGGQTTAGWTVIEAPGRCIGVTHPGDLRLVQTDLAGQIGRGERPAGVWGGPRARAAPVLTERGQTVTRSTRLLLALGANTCLVVGQVVAGLLAHSTSLLADAGHNLTDVATVLLSLGALRWATRPRSETRSFGNHRGTILAALVNAGVLAVVTCAVMAAGVVRLVHPVPVTGPVVAGVGGAALVMNALSAKVVSHDHHDLNMRSVLLHMAGDALASLLVVVAGVAVILGGHSWERADPAASVAVALLILFEAVRLLRESADVLLESTPRDVDITALRSEVLAVPGVGDVHDLHVWSLSSDYRALSAHLVLTGHPSLEEAQRVAGHVRHRIEDRFHIAHATLETECERCDEEVVDPCAVDERHGGVRVGAQARRSPE